LNVIVDSVPLNILP